MPVRIYDFPWRDLPVMGELDYVYRSHPTIQLPL